MIHFASNSHRAIALLLVHGLISVTDFRSMFDQMQQQMQSMMRNAMHEGGEPSSSPGSHDEDPHGRMVVFRSGPGFSSKKTYDFGPDGVVTKTETNGDRIGGDMSKWPHSHEVKILPPATFAVSRGVNTRG